MVTTADITFCYIVFSFSGGNHKLVELIKHLSLEKFLPQAIKEGK